MPPMVQQKCHPTSDTDLEDDEEAYFEYLGKGNYSINRYYCHSSYSSKGKGSYTTTEQYKHDDLFRHICFNIRRICLRSVGFPTNPLDLF